MPLNTRKVSSIAAFLLASTVSITSAADCGKGKGLTCDGASLAAADITAAINKHLTPVPTLDYCKLNTGISSSCAQSTSCNSINVGDFIIFLDSISSADNFCFVVHNNGAIASCTCV